MTAAIKRITSLRHPTVSCKMCKNNKNTIQNDQSRKILKSLNNAPNLVEEEESLKEQNSTSQT